MRHTSTKPESFNSSTHQQHCRPNHEKLRLTDDAVQHHEELFPNHESKLQKTDPEFIELFDNWAFDEVIGQSKLDTKTRVILRLRAPLRIAPGRAGARHAFNLLSLGVQLQHHSI